MNKKIIFAFCIFLLFVISGCNNKLSFFYNKEGSKDMGNQSNFENYEQVFKGEIVIYNLTRNDFTSFMQNPSYEFLKKESSSVNTYATTEIHHQTSNATMFVIQQKLLDFFGNYKEIQKYIAEKGVSGQIESMAVIDAVNFPITLWVKTELEMVYITVNDNVEDLFLQDEENGEEIYNYSCYSEKEFCEKFGKKDAKLIVDGEEIICKNAPIIYFDDADIPLLDVLTALGAEIINSSSEIKISLNDEIFYLNIEKQKLYKKGAETKNLLGQIEGGAIIIYPKGNDLMVDNSVLKNTLGLMGENVKISLDLENRAIIIS